MTKILLIEPDTQLLEEINIHLGKVGYKMHTTENGATGVQKALQYKPDLILCDAKPSGLSGDEVFNIIKQVNTTSVIPFVFITTKKSYEELRAVMNLGVDDFLVKPFTMDDIEKLIQIRIEKQRALVKKVNENFQTLVDYVNTAFCVYQEEKFEYVNRKFCEILGYSKSEIIGMNLVNLLYKDDIPKVVDKLTRIFKNIHSEINVDFRAIKRNREVVHLNFTGRLVEIDNTKNLVGTIKELTAQHLAGTDKTSAVLPEFTSREHDILHCICQGQSNQEIADKLNISVRTVEGHRNRLLKKTGCKNSVALAVYAIKHGLYKI